MGHVYMQLCCYNVTPRRGYFTREETSKQEEISTITERLRFKKYILKLE